MDYADLRTKDFKWAFENMRDLEELCVVASDMSDNVIDALNPPLSNGRIPLPKLKSLELCLCQRSSGEAVESMVNSRIEAARMGLVSPLRKLKIERCQGFVSEHYWRLMRVFQPRTGLNYIPYDMERPL